ncbi:hypothetical protein BGW42_005273 [Actinomortierella wolfii]|nr:hypothetical protein BGW42_005273 [Actinomortierella wolfii]
MPLKQISRSKIGGMPMEYDTYYELFPGRELIVSGLLRCTIQGLDGKEEVPPSQLPPVNDSGEAGSQDDSYLMTLPIQDLTQSIDNGHRLPNDITLDSSQSNSSVLSPPRPLGRILPRYLTDRNLPPPPPPTSATTPMHPPPSSSQTNDAFETTQPYPELISSNGSASSYEATQIIGGVGGALDSTEYEATQAFDANLEPTQVLELTEPMPPLSEAPQVSQDLVKATQEEEEEDVNKVAATQEDLLSRGEDDSLTPLGVPLSAVRRPLLRIPSTPVHVQQDTEVGSNLEDDVIPRTPEVVAPSSSLEKSQQSASSERASEKSTQEPLDVVASTQMMTATDPNITVVEEVSNDTLDDFEGDLSLPPTDSGDSPDDDKPLPLSVSSSSPSSVPVNPASAKNTQILKELEFSSSFSGSQTDPHGEPMVEDNEHGQLEPSASPTLATTSQELLTKLQVSPNTSISSTKKVTTVQRRNKRSSSSTASTAESARSSCSNLKGFDHPNSDDEGGGTGFGSGGNIGGNGGHMNTADDNKENDSSYTSNEDAGGGGGSPTTNSVSASGIEGKVKEKGRKSSPKRSLESSSESEEGGREKRTKSLSRVLSRQLSSASTSENQQANQQPQASQPTRQRSLQRTESAASITLSQQSVRRTRSQTLDREGSNGSLSSYPSSLRMSRGASIVSDAGGQIIDWSKPKVLFSGNAKAPNIKEQTRNLGGSATLELERANVVVMDSFKHFPKMYRAVLHGIPVVLTEWLWDCKNAKRFSEPRPCHYATDPELEEKFKFKMHQSVRLARDRAINGELGLFKGLTFRFLAPDNCYNFADYKELIEYELGKCGESKTRPTMSDSKKSTVILGHTDPSCAEYKECLRFADHGFHVVTKDFVLISILRQKLDLPEDFET